MNTTPNLRITKYEQSALVISTATTRLAIDFGTLTPETPALPLLDGALVSHVHADHFHPGHLTTFGAPIWAAAEVVERLAVLGQPATRLAAGELVTIGDIEIEPVDVNHGAISAPISNLGFILKAAGRTVFFAGDMAVASAPRLTFMDVLLLPVGGGKVFGPADAVAYICHLQHRGLVVPLHYHGSADPASAERFRELVDGFASVRVLGVGESLEVLA